MMRTRRSRSFGRFYRSSGAEARAPFFLSLDLFEITQWPALVEIGLGRLVKTEVGEPALTRDGWNPIRLESRRSGRTAINVHGGVGVFLQVHARRTVGDFLFEIGRASCRE